MDNLLHQNKKMTVFEVLETIEALRFDEGFVDGESVSAANVIIFPPEEDDMDTDEDDGNGVNCVSKTFVEGNFFLQLSWICREQEAQT